MLNKPQGIFVDKNLNLYVADCLNDRIQLILPGQLNGTTLAINGSNGTFTLACPTDIALDMDDYLFITDALNNRILGLGPFGFRCIVGCTGTTGVASYQLDHPHSLSFDSKGNLFVIEYSNNRLQKFFLSSNSCGKFNPFYFKKTNIRHFFIYFCLGETTTYPADTTVLEQTSSITTTVSILTSSTSIANQSNI